MKGDTRLPDAAGVEPPSSDTVSYRIGCAGRFFVVLEEGGRRPIRKSGTHRGAVRAAKELALKHPGRSFLVLVTTTAFKAHEGRITEFQHFGRIAPERADGFTPF